MLYTVSYIGMCALVQINHNFTLLIPTNMNSVGHASDRKSPLVIDTQSLMFRLAYDTAVSLHIHEAGSTWSGQCS